MSNQVTTSEQDSTQKQVSIFEQRYQNAKRGFILNLVLAVVFTIVFLGGVFAIGFITFATELMNPATFPIEVALLSLGGIALLVVGGMLSMYFYGHLAQCVRDIKDPTRQKIADEKI